MVLTEGHNESVKLQCLNDIYRITYNSEKEKAFIVHRSEQYGMTDLRFVEHPSGLHILQRPDGDLGATFVQTVEENMKMFTNRQVNVLRKHVSYTKCYNAHRNWTLT